MVHTVVVGVGGMGVFGGDHLLVEFLQVLQVPLSHRASLLRLLLLLSVERVLLRLLDRRLALLVLVVPLEWLACNTTIEI
jgi:hypothetical protein